MTRESRQQWVFSYFANHAFSLCNAHFQVVAVSSQSVGVTFRVWRLHCDAACECDDNELRGTVVS
jgi:serine protease inhibitor ecotin